MNRLAENLASVKARIASAQINSSPVRLIAVSKTRSANAVREVFEAGQKDFGENYLQEALEKIQALKSLDIAWHFIGPIQSNKTRPIAEHFQWVQSVDRLKIAERLSAQRPSHLPPLNTCIQINLDNEESKSGTTLSGAMALASSIQELENVRLRGLMFIPTPRQDYSQQLASCQRANAIFQQLKEEFPAMDTLSLGMSGDLEAAIQAGSNMVRIGTDIFGTRN